MPSSDFRSTAVEIYPLNMYTIHYKFSKDNDLTNSSFV